MGAEPVLNTAGGFVGLLGRVLFCFFLFVLFFGSKFLSAVSLVESGTGPINPPPPT